MSRFDLYWLPSARLLLTNGRGYTAARKRLKPIRGRMILGLLGLLLATGASLSLLAAVVHSWIVGSFTWSTPFDGFGPTPWAHGCSRWCRGEGKTAVSDYGQCLPEPCSVAGLPVGAACALVVLSAMACLRQLLPSSPPTIEGFGRLIC